MLFKFRQVIYLPLLFALSSVVEAKCVILLHGLARSSESMYLSERFFTDQGYNAVNIDYPSTTATVKVLAEEAIPRGLAQCGVSEPVYFYTHSMGGILVRQYLTYHRIPNLHRVVMLGPPNKGSELVDFFRDYDAFRWVNGPAGFELGTQADSLPNQLGEVHFDLGVIAGDRTINPLLSEIIPGPDDGKVSVFSTSVLGMRDHIILPVTHTFMMMRSDTMAQAEYYFKYGFFDRPE